jgi:hypothetical protein
MNDDIEVSVQQEVACTGMGRPHVVILGAGASRATCLNGDKNGNILPLMQDFTQVLGLKPLLKEWDISADQNFEEIFSDLYERQENDKISQIEGIVEEYFNQLELPNEPTIYDHLVLSLREKDLIATFNWDSLLVHAYSRNCKAGLKLSQLAFLHGNTGVGYCDKDKLKGRIHTICRICREPYKRTSLLYPIKRKDYAKDLFIAREWNLLKWGFENAFMITIFGYSGPKTDQEAISAMKKAWGDKYKRSMEQTAFITTQSEDEICENWDQFIHTHHYEIHDDFYNSWIANHPRRTGEAYINQYYNALCIGNNPIPRDLDFPELWKWYEKFKTAEDKIKTK